MNGAQYLRDVAQIKPPGDVETLSLSHLGTLYVLDALKNGTFSEADLFRFADLCASKESEYMQNEFSTMMQAHCTLLLWQDVTTPQGQDVFVDWFLALLSADHEMVCVGANTIEHVRATGVSSLHTILNVEKGYGLPLDDFVQPMRNAAELEGVLDPDVADAVPLPTLARFANHFIRGFASMMEITREKRRSSLAPARYRNTSVGLSLTRNF